MVLTNTFYLNTQNQLVVSPYLNRKKYTIKFKSYTKCILFLVYNTRKIIAEIENKILHLKIMNQMFLMNVEEDSTIFQIIREKTVNYLSTNDVTPIWELLSMNMYENEKCM